ncbi:LysR family transcriptional regulator [Vibrio spartinae]|uniref:D-malate degradation protein R n=1 Tax=Vibrio spartinae TaxID=1918945 RepID=A0ABX6R3G5_9VIBR|nr:LysR family transcriptional regulator [Vibrio spartinae]QMV15680.1 D-malate degradation protein R [Vibrio spartinae]
MNKLSGMEMFVKVVECGNFTAAAAASGVSSTMVAKQIRMVEERIGARLLHRTTRRQHLTEVGQLYFDRCLRVLSAVEYAENSAIELQAAPKGLVRMVAPVSFGCQCLVPELSIYMSRNPDVNVMLNLDNRISNLSDDNYELGIQIGKICEPGVVARPLRTYRRILAASPAYIRKHGMPDHPSQLCNHSCLGLSYWQCQDRWDLIGPESETFRVFINGRFMSNQGDALRSAAINGCGIVLQPDYVLMDDINKKRLVQVLPDWSYKPTPVFLTYLQDSRPSAKLRSLIDFLVGRLGI